MRSTSSRGSRARGGSGEGFDLELGLVGVEQVFGAEAVARVVPLGGHGQAERGEGLLDRVEVRFGAIDERAVAIEDQGVEGSFIEREGHGVMYEPRGPPPPFSCKVF